jgi:hypothetical protein
LQEQGKPGTRCCKRLRFFYAKRVLNLWDALFLITVYKCIEKAVQWPLTDLLNWERIIVFRRPGYSFYGPGIFLLYGKRARFIIGGMHPAGVFRTAEGRMISGCNLLIMAFNINRAGAYKAVC